MVSTYCEVSGELLVLDLDEELSHFRSSNDNVVDVVGKDSFEFVLDDCCLIFGGDVSVNIFPPSSS